MKFDWADYFDDSDQLGTTDIALRRKAEQVIADAAKVIQGLASLSGVL